MTDIIIAIDGFSSTGKSTFARLIAAKTGLPYLDSGAFYRVITLYALENGLMSGGDVDDDGLDSAFKSGKVKISFTDADDTGSHHICLNGVDVDERVRLLDIASNVSIIAAKPYIRNFVDKQLVEYGSDGCVVDGRDIGTAVFPDASLKIFMVADAKVRARRRVDEFLSKGKSADFEEVYKNVLERDYIDSHREFHPLCKADDAIVLDNSNMTLDEQMVWLDEVLKERFGVSLR